VRGLEVSLLFDEAAFQGSGVIVLASVLERFLGRYVTLNSFTETVLRTQDRGEIARWPARLGGRSAL
jgi:type VI secretion system protein ImpG